MAPNDRRPVEALITKIDLETDEPEAGDSQADWLGRGETIGRYIVLECLGVGGMGVIYSAWDPKLDRKLAIKVVRGRHGSLGSTRGRARLLREGQALARLRHPNVISVHDVGTHEGRVFVAMEFVEGQTLHEWLLCSPGPPLAELIDVFLQIGRGLAAAHRAGLVHRDVKPENVMLGDDGRVMVLDFGIAREELGEAERGAPEPTEAEDLDPPSDELDQLDLPEPRGVAETGEYDEPLEPGVPRVIKEDHTPLAHLTRAGAVVGTPAYMSPEQHRGRRVDARSDQFSFCVAMWEALNGEKPFGEGSRQKLLARMRTGQLKPFRNREVPRWIVVALRRGLAWTPSDRFESMETLLEAINPRARSAERRVLSALGVGAGAGVVAGALLTLAAFGLREPDPSVRERALAGAPTAGTGTDEPAEQAEALRLETAALDDAATAPTRAAELLVGRADLARRQGRLREALDDLEAARLLLERAGDPELRLPAILGALGELEGELGRPREAVVLLRRALHLSADAYGAEHPRLGPIRRRLARALAAAGEHEAALAEYGRALELLERGDADPREAARLRATLTALRQRLDARPEPAPRSAE